MSRFTFIHSADIHLDSPMLNLDRYDGAPVEECRSATRQALERMIELAIAESVRFLLVAGDLFDGDCRDCNTPRFFRKKMAQLEEAGIDVFVVQGNHDAENRMERAFRLQLPGNVHLFPTSGPETVELEDVGVAVHGQGFADAAVTEDLSVGFPPSRAGCLNIGLLHTNVGGRAGHDNYAPSDLSTLVAKGYDYCALGHIHAGEFLREGDPWIVYPGVIQGRHVNESGPKGCVLVTVEDGRIVTAERIALDHVRWERCAVDAEPCGTAAAVLSAAIEAIATALEQAENRLLAVRVVVDGASPAHGEIDLAPDAWIQELREHALDRFQDRVWIERVVLNTRAALDLEAALAEDNPLAEILKALQRPEAIREAISEIREELDALLAGLPTDARLSTAEGTGIDLDDPEHLAALADDVQRLLIPRLLGGGGQP